jgi:hypothetical protein
VEKERRLMSKKGRVGPTYYTGDRTTIRNRIANCSRIPQQMSTMNAWVSCLKFAS